MRKKAEQEGGFCGMQTSTFEVFDISVLVHPSSVIMSHEKIKLLHGVYSHCLYHFTKKTSVLSHFISTSR